MGDLLEPGATLPDSGNARSFDDHWVLIQLNTFTNWVKDQLTNHEVTVDDLRVDFCDGIRLCALMEMLQHRRFPHVVKKPINQHQCLDNINLALKAMTNDGIKLVNIGAEDICAGNLKLILGMVWRLILRYQIGRALGKTPPKKLMLAWINAVVPGQSVTNFNSDWNDGIALHGVVEYCLPGTFPNWNQLSRRNGLRNCQDAMEAAKSRLSIPMVLKPENLSNPDLDELSGMTYMSYFMKVNSPGHNATLRWVQQQIPHMNVKNFQADWNDGKVLMALVESVGGVLAGGVEHGSNIDVLQRAMNAAKSLGVDPVISAKEMSDPDVDHIGVMAYAARLQALNARNKPVDKPSSTFASPTPSKESGKDRAQLADSVKVVASNQSAHLSKKFEFSFDLTNPKNSTRTISVSVIGPSTRPSANLRWQGHSAVCDFTPLETGTHKIYIYNEDVLVKNCPVIVNVLPDVSQFRILSLPTNAAVGRPSDFKIGGGGGGGGTKSVISAVARSPSGQSVALDVIEKDGMLSSTFSPSESGNWSISFLCNGQHIRGSPFPVGVSDPKLVRVSGLERGVLGKATKFLVATAGAGSGPLTVDISHNGRPVKSQVVSEGHNSHRVNFTPTELGTHIVRVYYSGIEIEGSPFITEVVDSGRVVSSGQGLLSAEANHRSTFFLNLGQNGSAADIKTLVTSPRGNVVLANVADGRNGDVVVGYVPTEIGDHRIDVSYRGKAIEGSPFHVSVSDPEQIKMIDLPQKSTARNPVEFQVDASAAGVGKLEIAVNNGSVPCNIQEQNGQRYLASFLPLEAIPHSIQVKFNDQEAPGSPWSVDVHNPATVSIDSSSIKFIPVGKLAEFEVQVIGEGSTNGELGVNVKSPTQRTVHVNVINLRNGLHRVEFTPTEVGSHFVDVSYNRTLVPGCPFVAKVYNTSAIVVAPVNFGVVGRAVEFSIDVSQAGEGHLEIMVNRGTVPNNVQLIRKGVYKVSFVPDESRAHLVDIQFNKEPLPGGSISIPIVNPGITSVPGKEEMHRVLANRQSFLQLHDTRSISERDLIVRVSSPKGELVPAKIVRQVDGDYKVEYSSKFTGRHTVEILHNGEAIMGSPFYVEIYDPNKIRVEGCRTGEVGKRMEFDVICFEAGKAVLKVDIVGPRGTSVPYEILGVPLGEHVTYEPVDPGIYEIFMTYGGLEVPGCPIRQDVVDSSLVVADGDGLHRGVEDQVAVFYVDSKGQRGDLAVQVDGPNSISKCIIDSESGGRYSIRYVPVEVGDFKIKITWNGREIDGSPFHPKIVNPRKVEMVVGGSESILGFGNRLNLRILETNSLEFDCRHAGPGKLHAEVLGPGGKIPADVTLKERGKMTVSFFPKLEGEYQIRLMWNGLKLDQSPIVAVCSPAASSHSALVDNSHLSKSHQTNRVVSNTETKDVRNSSAGGLLGSVNVDKMVLTGMGLQHARVNQLAEFFIDGTHAGPGAPSVRLNGLKGDLVVNCTPVGDRKYRCTYTAPASGAYLLYVAWSDRQVSGSPFKVTVQPAADASKVICSMDGLSSGTVGRDIKAVLDIRSAGHGEPVVQCNGPTTAAICQLIDNYNGTFTLLVRPQESGRHVLQIKYGNDHIQGSPFVLTVAGVSDASKVRVHGPGVMDGILATYQSHFTVDTQGAGAGELTIKIRGPRGGFRVEMQRQSQKDRSIFCRYDPTEIGEYVIDIRWSRQTIPGSPFVVRIFDTHEDLRRFQMDAFQHGYNSNHNAVATGLWPDELS